MFNRITPIVYVVCLYLSASCHRYAVRAISEPQALQLAIAEHNRYHDQLPPLTYDDIVAFEFLAA